MLILFYLFFFFVCRAVYNNNKTGFVWLKKCGCLWSFVVCLALRFGVHLTVLIPIRQYEEEDPLTPFDNPEPFCTVWYDTDTYSLQKSNQPVVVYNSPNKINMSWKGWEIECCANVFFLTLVYSVILCLLSRQQWQCGFVVFLNCRLLLLLLLQGIARRIKHLSQRTVPHNPAVVYLKKTIAWHIEM